jgi:hypothetical protein
MTNLQTSVRKIMIHCKPEALDIIERRGLEWSYSKQFGQDEIDVITLDFDDLDDEDLCFSLGLPYQLTNCFELVGVV